jgi:hypothetical protein
VIGVFRTLFAGNAGHCVPGSFVPDAGAGAMVVVVVGSGLRTVVVVTFDIS